MDIYFGQNFSINLSDFLAREIELTSDNLEWCKVGDGFYFNQGSIGSCADDALILLEERIRGNRKDAFELLKDHYFSSLDSLEERELPRMCIDAGDNIKTAGVSIYFNGRKRFLTAITGCDSDVLYSDSEINWVPADYFSDCVVILSSNQHGIGDFIPQSVIPLQEKCRTAWVPPASISYDYLLPESKHTIHAYSRLGRQRIVN